MQKLKKKIDDEGKKLILKLNNIYRATTFFPYSDRTVDPKKQKFIFDDMGIT